MLLLEALEEDPSLPLPVLNSGWQSLVLLGLQLQHYNLCLCHHVASTLCVCGCVSSSYKDTSHVGLRPTLLQPDLILTNCFCNDPISKKGGGHILRSWGSGLQHNFWGGGTVMKNGHL